MVLTSIITLHHTISISSFPDPLVYDPDVLRDAGLVNELLGAPVAVEVQPLVAVALRYPRPGKGPNYTEK